MTAKEKHLLESVPREIRVQVIKSLQEIRNETVNSVLDCFCDVMCENNICGRVKRGDKHFVRELSECAKNTCYLIADFANNVRMKQKNNELIKWQ